MKMKRVLLLIPVMIAMIFYGLSVNAAEKDPMKKAIKARSAIMILRSWNAGPLFSMAKGETEYDSELADTLAKNMLAEFDMDNSMMWPVGSDNSVYPEETKSLPELWQDYEGSAKRGSDYVEAVRQLAEVAGGGLESLRSAIGGLGKSCKGCHDNYREE